MATENEGGMKEPDYQNVHVYLKCPVAKNGSVWVEVTFFGEPSTEAVDKTIELLAASRNP